jgi:hypothetical protein
LSGDISIPSAECPTLQTPGKRCPVQAATALTARTSQNFFTRARNARDAINSTEHPVLLYHWKDLSPEKLNNTSLFDIIEETERLSAQGNPWKKY